jgi:murein DD-endopeptidase MepM/ murein hydrolase activator NlpD
MTPFLVCAPAQVTADSTTDSLRDQIQAAKDEQDRIQSQIDALDAEAASSYENKQLYDQLASTTQNKIYLSGQYLTQLSNQIGETERSIAELQEKLDVTLERYLDRVRESYEDGNAAYIELILGSEDISDFLSRVERINTILEYDRDLMKGYESDMATLEKKKADLTDMQASEENAKAELEADQAYYDQLSEAENARIAALQSDEAALKQKQSEARAAEQELAAQLEQIILEYQQRQRETGPVSYVVSGAFMRPIPGGVGYVSQVFGETTFGSPHRGYDIACAAGTPILACANGTVITAGWHWSWGNYIVVDHGNGYTTLYAHCSALLVSAGQYVEQGQTIGLVGNTGYSFGAHLHIECTYGGTLVDGAAAGIPIYG